MNKPRLIINYFLLLLLAVGFFVAREEKTPKEEVTTQGEALIIDRKPPLAATVSAKENSRQGSAAVVTNRGDDLLVLINKSIRLPETYEPSDLIDLHGVAVVRSAMKMRRQAADALATMAQAARKEGAELVALSAYRSYWQQLDIHANYVQNGGLNSAEAFSAKPGHSQHQLGTAIDFTAGSLKDPSLSVQFSKTKEGVWLSKNAYRFGFVLAYPAGAESITGYSYEPWHYRFIGVENAQSMIKLGLNLEEFLQKYGVW